MQQKECQMEESKAVESKLKEPKVEAVKQNLVFDPEDPPVSIYECEDWKAFLAHENPKLPTVGRSETHVYMLGRMNDVMKWPSQRTSHF